MNPDDLARFRAAIASIESAGSGDYRAIGPTHPTLGRALGRFQIMEANLDPWSRAALGRSISADEFMASPEIQDQIFNHRFGGYVNRFGPEGAAQAWFAGPGGVGQMGRSDSLGTSVAEYTRRFNAALGQGGAPAMQAPAQAPMQPPQGLPGMFGGQPQMPGLDPSAIMAMAAMRRQPQQPQVDDRRQALASLFQ